LIGRDEFAGRHRAHEGERDTQQAPEIYEVTSHLVENSRVAAKS